MVLVVKEQRIKMWESIFRGAIASQATSLHEILIGLHYALSFGDILKAADINKLKDSELLDFFNKLDILKSCDLVETHKL